MRTGAIFARGSCRALKWVLALGMLMVLSSGAAFAQTTVIVPDSVMVTPGRLTIDEGAAKTFTVQLKTKAVVVPNTSVTNAPTQPDTVTVTVVQVLAGTDDGANFELDNQPINGAADARIGASGSEIAYEFTLTGLTTAGTVNATDGGESTVSARTDGNAVDGRNVLLFDSDWSNAAYDHDDDSATDDAGALDVTSKSVPINETDRDEKGVNVSVRALTLLEAGTGGTYTVVLGSEPTHDVTVTVAVTKLVNADIKVKAATNNPDTTADETSLAGTTTLKFLADDADTPNTNESTWNVAQTVTVIARADSNTLGGSATLTHAITSNDADYIIPKGPTVEVTEIDSVRTVTLSTSADTVDEGKTITITAELGSSDPETPVTLSEDVTITLTRGESPASGDYSVAASFKIAKNSTAGSTVLTAKHDADADNEKYTLTASATGPGILEISDNTIPFEIIDDDTYTLEADKTEVPEAGKVTLTVKVAPPAAVKTTVGIDLYRASGAKVAPAEGQDADDDGNVIIDVGGTSATFTLTAGDDPNDTEDEIIEVRAKAGGKVVGDRVSIKVLDTEASPEYTLSLAPDSIGEADGEASVMLTVMTNKAVTADTTLTLAVDPSSTAMDPDDYSITLAEVMIAKDAKMGMATLMVTPVMDSMDESNETIVLTAWMDDAQIGNDATLTIIDGDSAGSGIMAKSSDEVAAVFDKAIMDAGGLVAGQNSVFVDMSMLFDMANPDMMVNYTVSSSDAEVLGVYTAATDSTLSDTALRLAPMMAGESMVTVMAEAAGGAMVVASVTTAFTCTGACVTVNLTVWDAAVPALPVIGQLLLAALMGIGGYRRYRRR